MPYKGSKASQKKRKFIGQFQKNKKIMSDLEKSRYQQETLVNIISHDLEKQKHDQEKKIEQLKVDLEKGSKVVDRLEHQIKRKNEKIKRLASEQHVTGNTLKRKCVVTPSCEQLNLKAKSRRRKKTFLECSAIHGGNGDNIEPTVYGMLDTLAAKCKADQLSVKILNSKASVRSAIEKQCSKKYRYDYYKSTENILRSLNVYYSHHVMGKRKYINVRKANKAPGIPNFVSYKLLADKINQINIGTLKNIDPDLTKDLDGDEVGKGKFRDLVQYAPRIAQFYLTVNETRDDKLKCFENFHRKDPLSTMFLIAVGGDEAPLAGTTFLLSFLNVGKRIASSSENFLTFGANVKENGKVVRRYVLKLVSELKVLEKEVFEVSVHNKICKIEFKVENLPNDMKMLAFLAGELTNSAYYFTTFANVNSSDANDYHKTFGEDGDWKTFQYDKRIQDAAKVEKKKLDLSKKKIKEATFRTNVTTFISRELRSRQEEVPLVESFIDVAKCEPLHLKNNTTKEMFMKLVKVVLASSDISTNIKFFKDLPQDNLFSFFINYVRTEMNCNFLGKKMITWFNENKEGKGEKVFSFRFRGKESFNYLKYFPTLIVAIKTKLQDSNAINRLLCVFYQSMCLRKLVSFSVRIEEISAQDLYEMKQAGRKLFVSCAKYDLNVTPSLWTFSNVAPIHSEILLNSVGFGLGINTMEGREQKHQMVQKYSTNSTHQDRWASIFRHEYIQLVYLRENGFDISKYRKRNVKYMPDIEDGHCSCSLRKILEKCEICDSVAMRDIVLEIESIV